MIAYIETNFILELSFLQEEHESCEELLHLAEVGSIKLVVPAFSLTEARLGVVRLAKQRAEFHDRLRRELRELSRSRPYTELTVKTEPLAKALIESAEQQKRQLESATARLLRVGHVVPLETSTVREAIGHEVTFKLTPQDAVVYASVLQDLVSRPQGPKCFLNRNSKDFANPDIYDELTRRDCKMIPSFEDGLAYIRIALSMSSSKPPDSDPRPSDAHGG